MVEKITLVILVLLVAYFSYHVGYAAGIKEILGGYLDFVDNELKTGRKG